MRLSRYITSSRAPICRAAKGQIAAHSSTSAASVRPTAHRSAACVLAGFLGVGVLSASSAADPVVVSAQCNIFGAGHTTPRTTCVDPGSGPGVLPIRIDLPPGSICVEFPSVTGTVSYCGSCGTAGADGTALAGFSSAGLDGISGLAGTRIRTLNGVFLTAAEPANPQPPALTITDYTFAQFAPLIAQQFVIGDGLTGTGAGSVQRFVVPSGATRLFLGFLDGLDNCIGWWGDNSGSVTAAVVISGIIGQPAPVVTCVGGPASFSVTTSGTGPFTFQWRKDGAPINPSSNPSAATATLTLGTIGPGDVASYDCVVTNPCGSATSTEATLTLATKCSIADIVGSSGGPIVCGDATVDGSDFVAFINSFAIGDVSIDPLADVAGAGPAGLEPDGIIDGTDFVAFINAFALGC